MAQFTKKAIIETFVKLLNDTPLDKITVKDIVNECGINRNTFYYYYQDIYALLEDIFSIEIDKIVKETKSFYSWLDGCQMALQFALGNKRAVYHIYNSSAREQVERYVYAVLEHFMKEYVQFERKYLKVCDTDLEIITDFYIFALEGLIFDWIGKGMKEDAAQKLERLAVIFDGSVRNVIVKASDKL